MLLELHYLSWGRIMMASGQRSEECKGGAWVAVVDHPGGRGGGVGGRDDRGLGPESADPKPG